MPVICIVGLGYVGLPLAYAFARKKYKVIGYDLNAKRIHNLKRGHDQTRELSLRQLKEVDIEFSDDPGTISRADIVIVAVPTPIDKKRKPDLSMVKRASETVGKNMKRGSIIVFESTVYPGTTEEICGPILAKESGLICGRDFFLGYSPERINPGDKERTVDKIVKIVAGQNEDILNKLTSIYGSIIPVGIHRAPSIKVAEMAKAIENAQRDLNIAFVNEVALLCLKIGIPTKAVLEAAGTKWNFLPFRPGLVGGHCIGVDPYYLVEKAEQLGMKTKVITAGRSVNDGMSKVVANQILGNLTRSAQKSRILILGLTFKENVPDIRNSRVFDVIKRLQGKGCTVLVNDPLISTEELTKRNLQFGFLNNGPYDAIALLVSHKEYCCLSEEEFINSIYPSGIFYDLKSLKDGEKFKNKNIRYLSL